MSDWVGSLIERTLRDNKGDSVAVPSWIDVAERLRALEEAIRQIKEPPAPILSEKDLEALEQRIPDDPRGWGRVWSRLRLMPPEAALERFLELRAGREPDPPRELATMDNKSAVSWLEKHYPLRRG